MAKQLSLLEQYQQMADKARLSNISRQKAVESIFDEIIARYGPGGQFGKGYEAELGAQKTRDVGATAQRDISRGLYGIRPYEQEWEKTVGAGARLKLEDLRMERLSQAQTGKASFLERIEEPYPDYSALMQAYSSRASSVPAPAPVKNDWMTNYRPLSEFMGRLNEMGPGGGATTPTSTAPTYDREAAWAEQQKTFKESPAATFDPEAQKKIYADLLAGQKAGTAARTAGSLQQSVFADKPPQWTGNYQTWKSAMDAYNKAHGLSLSGY